MSSQVNGSDMTLQEDKNHRRLELIYATNNELVFGSSLDLVFKCMVSHGLPK